MRAIRSIVRGFFAIQALFLLVIPVAAMLGGLRPHLRVYLADSTPSQINHAVKLAYLAAAVMLGLGLVYAAAWWTSRKTEPDNWMWAIAASTLTFLQGVMLLMASHLTKGRVHFSAGESVLWVVVGAVGVYLFANRGEAPVVVDAELVPVAAALAAPVATEAAVPIVASVGANETAPIAATTEAPVQTPVERMPIAGDRTSVATRHAVTVFSCIAQIAAIVVWYRWANWHDLVRASAFVWLLFVAAASVMATLIHECGHVLMAWCFEMNLLSFKAGPFQWIKREGKWSFKLGLAGLLTPGGAVGAVSNDPDQPRWEEILMIAAGPLANLLIGVAAIYAVLHDDWPHYQQTWELAALTASFCVIAAVLNMIPFLSEEGMYSDGARILQIISGSPLDEYHRTMASIASTATTERRYRDLDVDAIQRAASLFPSEFRGLHLELCACHCFEDRNMTSEASAALASAEAIYNSNTIDLPAPLHTNFVIGHAYLNHDATAARTWWDRMEAKKNDLRNVDYWLARTALLWIEGDQKGAGLAWSEADERAQVLPKFGAYEFDRYRCFLLRQALNDAKDIARETPEAKASALDRPAMAAVNEVPAAAPILPAWITPGVSPELPQDKPPFPSEQARTQVSSERTRTPDYSDSASMFARLSSLTARPVQDPLPPSTTDVEASDDVPAVENVETETHTSTAASESEPIAHATGNDAGKDADRAGSDVEPPAQLSRLDDMLPSLTMPAASPEGLQPVTWSAKSSAPLLASTPAITPLPIDPWTALPTAAAPVAVQTFAVESTAPKLPTASSVPAAFARKPRFVGPITEDPFAVYAAEQSRTVETETVEASGEQQQLVSPEALAVVAEQPVSEAVQAHTPEPFVSAAEVVAAQTVVASEKLLAVEAPTPAVEAPRFDPLAFIRAAALENLTT